MVVGHLRFSAKPTSWALGGAMLSLLRQKGGERTGTAGLMDENLHAHSFF